MEIRYDKDLEHEYLRIMAADSVDMESYPMRILIGNEVPGLLPCRIENVDGQKEFCYEISSEQTVKAAFLQKRLRAELLRELLQGFLNALTSIQAFLLDVDQLILQTDHMYYDSERNMLRLCYFPGYNRELQLQFRTFLEELLTVIDHQDAKAVAMGYGIYQKMMEKGFHLEIIREFIYRTEEEADERSEIPQEEELQLSHEEIGEAVSFEQEVGADETKTLKIPWKLLLISGLWAAALLGIGMLRLLGYLSVLSFSVIFGVFLAGLGITGACSYVYARKKGKAEPLEESADSIEDEAILWPSLKEEEPDIEMQTERLASRNPGEAPDIWLKEPSVLIGKLEGAVDAVIPKSTISRIHARFRREGDFSFLIDLNSTNGTYVNGTRISCSENYPIKPGDEIRFADVVYVYKR